MADDLLDSLPLPVLLALHEAMADPTEHGRERARNRALDAGFHIHCMGAPENDRPPRVLTTPIPMEPAPDGWVDEDHGFAVAATQHASLESQAPDA